MASISDDFHFLRWGVFSVNKFSGPCSCHSITQSSPTLRDPMDYSIPGFPIHHLLGLFNLMSFELVVTSNHLVLCCPLLFLPSIIPRIKVFPNKSALHGLWGSLIGLIIFMFGKAPQSSLALKLGYPHTSLYENPEQ